jgi:antitoxin (DNA-binding transcriptional repressor) of toxin-antitoxin stability system
MQTIEITPDMPQLQALLHRMDAEPVVLSEHGMPLAMLVPYPKATSTEPRVPGIMKGEIVIHDNFDDPLPPDVMKYFE